MRRRMIQWQEMLAVIMLAFSVCTIVALMNLSLFSRDSLYVTHVPGETIQRSWGLVELGSYLLVSFGSSIWLFVISVMLLSISVLVFAARAVLRRIALGTLCCAIAWQLYGALFEYSLWGDPFYGSYSWMIPGGIIGKFIHSLLVVEPVISVFGIFLLALLGVIFIFGFVGMSALGRMFFCITRPLAVAAYVMVRAGYRWILSHGNQVDKLFILLKQKLWSTKIPQAPSVDLAFWDAFGVQNKRLSAEEEATVQALDAYAQQKIVPEEESAMFVLPTTELFVTPPKKQERETQAKQEVANRVSLLEAKLQVFGIAGEVTRSERGPVVTLLEYLPAPEVTVSRISARADDVALALGALSLRVIAPIPGKMVVGFEVANERRQIVYFSELFDSPAYQKFSGAVPAVVGAYSDGSPCILDMVQQPHMLIAGSTGSGKSVVMHALILGMLGARTPDELRFVMIDPKRLEFAPYSDIPHLLLPIVTELNEVAKVFAWLVRLMEERYAKMAEAGVRSIDEYCSAKGRDAMPYIMVIVDELADIMVTVGREVEPLMIRLAQMARAAGIHLIFATQRPSVDVITGVMKVNFPTRIALKVASKIDSRTIIDVPGAEQLLGKGDMLLMQQGGYVERAHGAFVQSKEVHAVASYLRMQQRPVYEVIEQASSDVALNECARDSLYPEVVVFLQQRTDVSISLLQRQFKIGFNRSARLIDQLEVEGYIAPAGSGKLRRVLRKD